MIYVYVLWAVCLSPFAYDYVYPKSSGETTDGQIVRRRSAVYMAVFVNIVFILINIYLEQSK